jgi:quinol monooxygenase YgiN
MGIGRFTIHEGALVQFKRLAAQAIEIARTMDTGTLQYEIFFDDEESECIVIERYKDSEALMEHAAHVGDVMAKIFAVASGTSDMLGDPSAELRTLVADGNVRLFTSFLSL